MPSITARKSVYNRFYARNRYETDTEFRAAKCKRSQLDIHLRKFEAYFNSIDLSEAGPVFDENRPGSPLKRRGRPRKE